MAKKKSSDSGKSKELDLKEREENTKDALETAKRWSPSVDDDEEERKDEEE
jgi:hypothetical protein